MEFGLDGQMELEFPNMVDRGRRGMGVPINSRPFLCSYYCII